MKRNESKTEKMATVSIVDDDPSVRKSILRACRLSGLAPKPYGSAEEFLTSGETPDCLVSDVGLPGINGLELQQVVRAATPQVPVILITARTDKYIKSWALNEGAFDVLRKPLDADQLLQTIQRAVGREHTERS